MNVGKVSLMNSTNFKSNPQFKGEEYENPVSRSTEKNLAVLKSVGWASAFGVITAGLVSTLVKEGQGKKYPIIAGLAAAAVNLMLTLPAALYNTKVNAYVKQKEMDVFSRDRSLKTNLTEEVDKEVQDSEVSLDKKLDDNLKLQMANRGNAVGIADITSQPQG
ncbi:MAG: hypothetical protein WCG95_04455 [bacterium]